MTPQEIRAAALQVAVGYAATRSVVFTATELKNLADTFAEYIEGPEPEVQSLPPLPQRRAVPILKQCDEPAEHIDHDGELWGALCAGCAHSKGVHKFGGCHFPIEGSDGHTLGYCDCGSFTDVRPAGGAL